MSVFFIKTGQWHELKLVVNGDQIQGYLDGKVGVWSKSDSVINFDDFTVKTP